MPAGLSSSTIFMCAMILGGNCAFTAGSYRLKLKICDRHSKLVMKEKSKNIF